MQRISVQRLSKAILIYKNSRSLSTKSNVLSSSSSSSSLATTKGRNNDNNTSSSLIRSSAGQNNASTYEPSPVTAFAKQDDRRTFILGSDRYGFNVNNIRMRGSVLCFPNFTLLWNVTSVRNISPRSIAPVHMIKPRVELCIIGVTSSKKGEKGRMEEEDENVNPALFGYLSRKGVALEVMSTANAIATFNLLQAEDRPVCAALISREPMSRDDACLYTDDVYKLETDRDREILSALATDVLPQDRDKFITDGGRSSVDAASEFEARNAAAAQAAMQKRIKEDQDRRLAAASEIEHERLSKQFGYPGMMYKDPKILGSNNTTLGEKESEDELDINLERSRRSSILKKRANRK
jgi:uncharacterized protein